MQTFLSYLPRVSLTRAASFIQRGSRPPPIRRFPSPRERAATGRGAASLPAPLSKPGAQNELPRAVLRACTLFQS